MAEPVGSRRLTFAAAGSQFAMYVHIHDIALLNCLGSEIARAPMHGFRIDELTASDGGSSKNTIPP